MQVDPVLRILYSGNEVRFLKFNLIIVSTQKYQVYNVK